MRFPIDRFILHKVIEPNFNGRDFVVGDIHGHLDKLIDALCKVSFDFSADRLFCAGDLIDRGPKSVETIDVFSTEAWAHSTLGNHEWILIREMVGDPKMVALAQEPKCGAEWRSDIDCKTLEILVEKIYQNFPIAMTVKTRSGYKVGLIHASPPENWDIFDSPDEDFLDQWTHHLWSRDKCKAALTGEKIQCGGVDAVVCGHHTIEQPVVAGNVAFVDTHVSWSGEGAFTVLQLEELLERVENFL